MVILFCKMAKLVRYRGLPGLLLLVMLFANALTAQKKYALVYKSVDKDSAAIATLKLSNSFGSKLQCADYIKQLPAFMQARGYITASIDSLYMDSTRAIVYLFFGEAYNKANIRVPETSKKYLEQAGISGSNTTYISLPQYQAVQQKLMDWFENTGYPFASIKLDSLVTDGQSMQGQLAIEKGMFYKIDSIRMLGPAKISRNFIHHYLDIGRGSFYNQQNLTKINQRLLELPYVQQAQPWDVTMLNTGSIVNLYLVTKKSNQINVLAGFLPDNRQLGGGKLLFTIDANLQLKNAFGTGENIGLIWQQIQPRSPRLHLEYQQPYIVNSPVGVDFSFDLFKKDSIFLNLNAELGINYIISPNQSTKISIQNQRTNILQIDTFTIKNSRQLPDIADVSSINLLLDYEANNTNYRFNPVRGSEVELSLAVGNKKIRKNAAITQIKDPAFNYNSLYDTLKLNTYQLRLSAAAAHYIPLGRQGAIKTGIRAGVYESPNSFRNELFQIGGYKLLRGFDEESIYANRYAVATIEYRYLLGLNSYFFGFTDLGKSYFKNQSKSVSNTFLGGGVGLAFETKGGIFNISYAAGKRNDLRFNIKESKIHFGYVSVF